MTYNILFAVVGIGLIALSVCVIKLDNLVESWRVETLRHTRLLNNIDDKQYKDADRLGRAFKRIQDLENQLEGMSTLVATLEEKLNNSGGKE